MCKVQQKITWQGITSRKWVVSMFKCLRFCRQEILLLSSLRGQSKRTSEVRHVSWPMLSGTCMRPDWVSSTYTC